LHSLDPENEGGSSFDRVGKDTAINMTSYTRRLEHQSTRHSISLSCL